MGIAFDFAPNRPAHIDQILNGLERYNPETTTTFQDYVQQQCDDRTYDCYANLALLKLYQFNPHLTRDDTVTAILTKSLTVFPSPDFSLCLHLLPATILGSSSPSNPLRLPSLSSGNRQDHSGPIPPESPLTEAVHKLTQLNTLLEQANYSGFWSMLESDDLYADLTSDVAGFEELMRVRIAATLGQSYREIERYVVEEWLNLRGPQFEKFVTEVCGWGIDDGPDAIGMAKGAAGKKGNPDTSGSRTIIRVPINKENEAKGTVVREDVKFDQFARVVRRAWEEPA